jgi:hypothetical protein
MINSYLNILTFLLTTLVYYLAWKPKLNYNDLTDSVNYKKYLNNNNLYLAVYFFAIVVVQFIVNAYLITQTCGGNITQNMAASGTFTFIPWSLIFGAVIAVLIYYPGFKSAFSDVIGYYYVSSSANKLFAELFVNTKSNENLNESSGRGIAENTPISIPDTESLSNEVNPSAPPIPNTRLVGGSTKKELENVAEMVVKICGNASILINQIVPSNFVEYWNMLKPLMKPQYQIDGAEADGKRNQLFELVVTRDNIGESMWYIYTGLLITSIVQLKIATRGCVVDPAQMAKNYQKYVSDQEATKKQQQKATSSVYTLTN